MQPSLPSPARAPLRVGLLGFGTVGAGTHDVLTANHATIAARAGRAIALTQVATRRPERARAVVASAVEVHADTLSLAAHPDVDVVVEAIGGTTHARDCVLAAIAHGKHVVTSNKALLAEHGAEIFAAARERRVGVAFEGAVAVSIPIVKALREGLTANRIEWLAGIVNGTSNFVLTRMRDAGQSYEQALRDAQALGYAEADPALDVDGGDAAHKLALLAALAFGGEPRLADVHVEGIRGVEAVDLAQARRLGFAVKLLAVARRAGTGVELRVHPALVAQESLLGRVDGRMNGILVQGDAAGLTMYYGAGAGARETASAVVADLVDLARARGDAAPSVPALGFHGEADAPGGVEPLAGLRLRQYLRVPVAGADSTQAVLATLGRHGVQAERVACCGDDLVVLTQAVEEAVAAKAVAGLGDLAVVRGAVVRLRVEELDSL